jgi:DNA-directed RNA polymerase subunit RPC12/RpoP
MDWVPDEELYRCLDCGRELADYRQVVTLVAKDETIRGICGRCWSRRQLALRN